MSDVLRLPDGTYDVVVVDAKRDHDGLALEITILSGEHKGDVVTIRTADVHVEELDALGMPGTLRVEKGIPHFVLEK